MFDREIQEGTLDIGIDETLVSGGRAISLHRGQTAQRARYDPLLEHQHSRVAQPNAMCLTMGSLSGRPTF